MSVELSPALLLQLRLLTGLTRSELYALIETAPKRYKVYSIPKRTSGVRTIAQPSRELKQIQYSLMYLLLRDLPVHVAAHAYVVGRSIATNAAVHSGRSSILKLDFENFFNSISAGDFKSYMHKAKPELLEGDLDALVRIFFWCPKRSKDLVLSVGAPSSPMISNILMCELDGQFQKVADEIGAKYSRYADDLTFSHPSAGQLWDIVPMLGKIVANIRRPNLKFKDGKTHVFSPRGNRRVTGVVLTNQGDISLGRERKRLISAACHRFLHQGSDQQSARELLGWISHARSVDGGFADWLAAKYGKGLIDGLAKVARFEREGVS